MAESTVPAEQTTKTKMDTNTKIKWAITLIVPLILFLIPYSGFYTYPVKMFFVITVFGLFVIAFEFFHIAVMAALLPPLWAIFQVAPLSVAMAPWTGTTMYMCLGAFLLAATLEESGLLKRVSYWIMSKTGSNYALLLFGLFGAGVAVTALTFGTGYIVMAALCYGLCRSLGIMGTRMSAAIAMVCMIGTCSAKCFTYSATTYAIIIGMAKNLLGDFDVNVFQAVGHNWPMAVVSLITIFVIVKWYKADRPLNGKEYFKEELDKLGPMNHQEKANIFVLALVVGFLLTNPLHHLDSAYGFMIFPWLIFLPFINGATAESFKNINWGMIFFIAGCMAIGTVASSLGFGTLINDVCVPLFEGTNNIFYIFGMVFLIVFVLNFLMTPLAIWALITEPVVQISMTLGLDPRPFIYALMHCAEAIILPYEYVPYLTVYAFGMMSMIDFIKMNIVRCIIYVIGFIALLVPYWYLIGVIKPLV